MWNRKRCSRRDVFVCGLKSSGLKLLCTKLQDQKKVQGTRPCTFCLATVLPAYDEQVTVILGVNSPPGIHRSRRISGADGQLLEDALHEDTSLPDRVQVAVFTIGVYHAVSIHDGRSHAPLDIIG